MLLVLFAVGAKLAMYQAHAQAKQIAATKVWQNDTQAADEDQRVDVTPSLSNAVAMMAVLSSLAIAATWPASLDGPLLPAPSWFSPYLSVRPPPTL